MVTAGGTLRQLRPYFLGVLVWAVSAAMHIPDGYLGPLTAAVMFLLALPFWVIGLRRIRAVPRRIPLVALAAAFSFVIMMFNVPLPGGTSGHAVGAALAGIILGPESATIAVTLALVLQALFFGDGGILAIGANSFNIAVVVPFVAVAIYTWISGTAPLTSRRRLLAAAFGGWTGLTTAALLTGIEFGIQPILHRSADGAPLYAPYSLGVAIPAMLIPHALVASVVEGVLTALIFAYLQRANLPILESALGGAPSAGGGTSLRLRGLWVGLVMLAIAAPLGLLAPGTAWGEWGAAELANRGLPSIPVGLARLSELWGSPFAGYAIPGLGNANLGYLLSAILGVLLFGLLAWLLSAIAQSRDARR